MATTTSEDVWPPRSARQALLSSPSGRAKYSNRQSERDLSPVKRQPGTPSLLDRLRLARNDKDHVMLRNQEEDDDDEDEDEETLKLKLAAIEAKLKIKKLQTKKKLEDAPSFDRPASVVESNTQRSNASTNIEIALSPIRRPQTMVEQRSPSRVLLGIDKGMKGADMSLRRAKTTNGSPVKDRAKQMSRIESRPGSRSSATDRHSGGLKAAHAPVKSFSERMAQVRDDDRAKGEKYAGAQRARTKRFQVDQSEIEQFKAAAEASHMHSGTRSGLNLDANDDPKDPDMVNERGSSQSKDLTHVRQDTNDVQGDATLFEGCSGLHLATRILPHSFLKRTLPKDQFTTYRIPDLLKNVTSPAYELPDGVGDFVVFGVLASKSNPFDTKSRADELTNATNEWDKKWDDGTQNRKKFMVFTLTDLKWTIDLYLFDTALPRYHRLTTGTVIAILNPSIMPPKKGREDTGAFSLALHSGDDTVLEIGSSQHLGHCNVTKRDGKPCGQWVDCTKSEICEWHLNAQIAKTQSKRMGVNTGANGFGGGPGSQKESKFFGGRGGKSSRLSKRTHGFDWNSQSQYYVSNSNPGSRAVPAYRPDVSSAKMLDLDDDDPFVAEGQLSRDKGALLQKRMATQEKERNIAKQLSNFGSGSSAGADYLRRKAEGDTSLKPRNERSRLVMDQISSMSSSSALKSSDLTGTPLDLKTAIGRKRTAQDVRLSPVKKKTRFLTDKGIKEAGRESLGAELGVKRENATHENGNDDDDDDDDDLDII